MVSRSASSLARSSGVKDWRMRTFSSTSASASAAQSCASCGQVDAVDEGFETLIHVGQISMWERRNHLWSVPSPHPTCSLPSQIDPAGRGEFHFVIPGPSEARSPESILPAPLIMDSRLAPEPAIGPDPLGAPRNDRYAAFFPFSANPASARKMPAAPRRRAFGDSQSSKNTTFMSGRTRAPASCLAM